MMTSWTDFLALRGATFDDAGVAGFSAPDHELEAARDTAVLCDLTPIGALRLAGADAETFLQGQFTNDVAATAPGDAQYSAWCSAKGRMLANFLLLRIDPATFEILLPGSMIAAVRKRLAMFVLRSKVTIDDASGETVRIGVGGPAAVSALRAAEVDAPAPFRWRALDGGWIAGVAGGRYIAAAKPADAESLWNRLAQVARPAGFPVWQWLTLRAGVPVVTPATTERLVPQMANWDVLGGVSFRKGCYAGQEIVARTQYLGRLKERTALAHVDGPPPEPGEKLFSREFGDQSCGTVLNAARSPDGGSDFLAALQLAAIQSGDIRIGTPEGSTIALLPLPYPLPDTSATPTSSSPAPRGLTA